MLPPGSCPTDSLASVHPQARHAIRIAYFFVGLCLHGSPTLQGCCTARNTSEGV